MKYTEAVKLATPGPLMMGDGNTRHSVRLHTTEAVVCEVYDDNKEVVNGRVNAALPAHCYNHFGELLDTLKDMRGLAVWNGWEAQEPARSALKRAKKVIAKCDEVAGA